MTSFITSKKGYLNTICLYKYLFTEDLKKQPEQLQKFKKWITKADEIKLYNISESGFAVFEEMPEISTWQYMFKSSVEIEPPFENLQKISAYISTNIRNSFEKQYERYLGGNIYVTDKIDLAPFILKKCIGFNVELFKDGKLLVHFLPSTKLTSPDNISLGYINRLRNNFKKQLDDIELTLVETKRNRRLKIDLFSDDGLVKASEFIEKNENVVCTFNYHFVSSYSPEIFSCVVKDTIKEVDKSIFYLEDKLQHVDFNSYYHFQDKPFSRVVHSKLGKENNLRIGNDKCVSKPSAAFYSGIFKPAKVAILQPVFVGNYYYDGFEELVLKFNQNSYDFQVLEPIKVNPTDDLRFDELIHKRNEYRDKKFLAAIFSMYSQPYEFTQPLKESKISYQMYLGAIDNYKLSNYAVKCLEKLGGHLSIIDDLSENEATYFVGIDLGHSSNDSGRFTNMALVFFNNKGEQLYKQVRRNLPLNEALIPEAISPCFNGLRKFIRRKGLTKPQKFIIHRDGKLHVNDTETILNVTNKFFKVKSVDVVEIVKHGYPVFACFEEGAYMNLESGDYFQLDDYAILVTNIQANEKNAIANPIIIKHKYGDTKMETIVRQVYWFTKVYTNNLYNSTRLPATTLKANNIVSTSLKEHHATYLG